VTSTQSKKLNELKDALHHHQRLGHGRGGAHPPPHQTTCGDPENLILFVGYCAENTLGAQLRAGRSPVNIFGEPHLVRAQVAAVDAFSGHADCHELAQYVNQLGGDIRRITVIHGEEAQSLAFAETLRELRPKAEVIVPVREQVLEF
jgi:metallo-beta-lactamase family protein